MGESARFEIRHAHVETLMARIARCRRDVRCRLNHTHQIASDAKFFTSDANTPRAALNSQEKCHKSSCEIQCPVCRPAMRKIGMFFKIERSMRNACDSDPRCGLACDATSAGGVSVRFKSARVGKCV